jgi:hypothetical protein
MADRVHKEIEGNAATGIVFGDSCAAGTVFHGQGEIPAR